MNYLEILRARLAELNEQRDAAHNDMETSTAVAVAETRSELNPDETAAFEAAQARVDELDEKIAGVRSQVEKLELVEQRRAAAPPASRPAAPAPQPADVLRMTDTELRTAATTAVRESRYFTRDEHRNRMLELIDASPAAADISRFVLVAGTPEYRSAWMKLMSGSTLLTADESRAVDQVKTLQRAMSVGTTTAGGFAVPPYLDPTMVITGAGSANPFRQLGTVKQLASGNTWKGLTAGQVSASWDGEATAVSDDSPTLAQPAIPVFAGRGFIPASFETFEDVENLAADVAVLLADAKDQLEAIAFATGNGTTAPKGVMTAVAAVAGSRVATTSVGVYAVADVYKLHQALPPRHRLNGSKRAWITNVATINSTRQFATANNYHAFLTDLGGGQPSQLLGDALHEASTVNGTVATGNDIMCYGDFAKFNIVDHVSVTTEFIPNLFDTATGRPTGQRGWLMHWRSGSDVVDPDAFRVLRVA